MGQARLAIKFEEDLRKQVNGFRWHGRSKKFEQPNEINQRERNESEIIYYYLHCPDHRLFIREELLKREIDNFNTEYIRLIWESITSIEVDNLGPNYLDDLKNPNNKKLSDELISINLTLLLPDHFALNNLEVSNNINTFINPD